VVSTIAIVQPAAHGKSRNAREFARIGKLSGHARPCAGHPRLGVSDEAKDVDGRVKPGPDS
jgi:hypothetical protein